MSHTFIAYIDESGDDGLKKFREVGKGGSTKWLTISACVLRLCNDLDCVKWRDEIAKSMKLGTRAIHFRDHRHSQKIIACKKISDLPIRTITVMSDKTTIPKGVYNRKNQLYHYLTRYLVERISWLCRDMRPRAPEGDGRVKIIFSKRGGMDYADFRQYLATLKSASGENMRIHWPVIDIDAVEALDHSTRAGLQLADCVTSAFRAAVDPDEYGNCENRYAKTLKTNVYSNKGKYISYGLKPIPNISDMVLSKEQSEFFEYFADPK